MNDVFKVVLGSIIMVLIGFCIIFVLSQTVFAQTITKEEISAWKESDKEDTGAYKQELYNGEYEVHVYETPKREYGYQIIEYRGEDIYSTGYGVEADSRTYTIFKTEEWVNTTSTDKQNEKVI